MKCRHGLAEATCGFCRRVRPPPRPWPTELRRERRPCSLRSDLQAAGVAAVLLGKVHCAALRDAYLASAPEGDARDHLSALGLLTAAGGLSPVGLQVLAGALELGLVPKG